MARRALQIPKLELGLASMEALAGGLLDAAANAVDAAALAEARTS